MRNLSSLLQRISKVLDRGRIHKEIVISVVLIHTNIPLKESQVCLKGGVLEITTTSIMKNEISLKEREILESLKLDHGIMVSKIFYK